MTTDYLHLEQQELEVQAFSAGELRYQNQRQLNQASANGPELKFISKGMDKLVPAIIDIRDRLVGGESMVGARTFGTPILVVDPDHIALITLSTIYNLSGSTRNAIFNDVANRLSIQIAYETVKHHDKGVAQWIETHRQNGVKNRELTMIRQRAENYTKTRWSAKDRTIIGGLFCSLAVQVCDEIEETQVYTSRNQYAKGIQVKPEVRERIEQMHSDLAILSPVYLPMIVPPKDWTTMWDGGYLLNSDEFSCTHPIIKESLSRELKRTSVETFGLHLEAINHLQQTRWTGNEFIRQVCKDIDINDAAVGSIIGTKPKELPDQEKVDWNDPEQKQEYCAEARPIHDYNRRTVGKRTLFYQLRSLSKRFTDKYDQFYFAWQMDFRGRFYPRFCGFDPQGDKLNKAYLRFAEGVPLGPDGYEQLTLHLANSLGYDKLSLDDRLVSARSREEDLRRWVADPLRETEWTDEDGPYLLAVAEEWLRATDSGDPESFVSHMPCAIDGKCNGLQHLSALARDPVGAEAVCLVPSDQPKDIYMLVKHKVDEYIDNVIRRANLDQIKPILPEKIEKGQQKTLSVKERELRLRQREFYSARNWKGKVERKTVKRGAMTWAYGVTPQGIMDQLIADGFLDNIEGSLPVNAMFMRDAIYWAVNNVVTSARSVMEWLQEVASIAFDNGKAVRWTNPAGMLVTQEYLRSDYTLVHTVTGRFRFYQHKKNAEMVKSKQVNGIAPNFVHSIDAAHMANVVLRLKQEGIQDMHMIHDSFGVHARHVPLLHRIVREEFVKIHERNLLQEFKEEVERDLGVDLPDYPEQGDFDVKQVLDSKYAFS